jgi:hypothetical protein
MELKVDYCLMFSDKELRAFILEGKKENKPDTYDSEDEKVMKR